MTRSPSIATVSTAVDPTDSGTATIGGTSASRRLGREIQPGTAIGRYVVRRRLGAGGMGEVFAARDTELDREVALKLIHERELANEDSTIRECERVRQEAQALARLSHPNVVQIYEVGLHGEHTYLAMELVLGPTLGDWRPGSLAQLLDVFVQAGRGLAAAHQAGLAHRDFKPSNVIVGVDGRARVLDFGLAKPAQAIYESSQTIGDESDEPQHPRASSSIGGPGTLPYMAPEQAFSGTGGPLGDQFSFCVALFEAIYGARPFPARTVMELLAKLDTCTIEFPPTPRVPRWLRKLLARGLSRNPADRFPSMDLLLAELGRDRTRVWRRLGFAAAVSGLTALAMLVVAPARPVEPSEPAPDLAGVWDSAQREAVGQAFARVHHSWADGSEAAVLAGLDAWSDRWLEQARNAHGLRDPLRRRAIDACLASQRAQAELTITAMIDGEPALLEGAVAAVDALPEPSRCAADPDVALALIDPAILLPKLHALADAATQRNLGRFELARTGADALVRDAQASGWTSLELAALRQRGLATLEAGDRAQGLADLEQARDLAVRSGDRPSEAELWVDLAWASRKLDNPGLRRDRLALARAHIDALASSSHADEQRDEQARHVVLLGARVQLASALELLRGGQQLGEAEALLLDGLATLAAIDSEASLLAIDYLHALARVRESAGRFEQAERDYQLAIAKAERVRGHDHPSNARVIYDAGALAHQLGDVPLARERLTHARDLRAAALRVDHPELARSELGLAQLEYLDDNLEPARDHAERALQVLEDSDGDRDAIGETLRMLGQLEARALRWDAAITHYERALPLTEADASQHALVELELGKAYLALDQTARGVDLLDAALPIIAQTLGRECAQLRITYERHAEALARLGHTARAHASLQAAAACATDPEDPRP